jgi:hypothetical protein
MWRLVLATLIVSTSCGGDSSDSVELTSLGADPASEGFVTSDGHLFAVSLSGALTHLPPGATTWAKRNEGRTRIIENFADKATLATNALGVSEVKAGVFVQMPVPPPPVNGDYATIRIQDISRRLWSLTAANVDATKNTVIAAVFTPGATTWEVTGVPVPLNHTVFVSAITADGRAFYRPRNLGVWELDLKTKTVIERIPCTHPIFRPSHPDYVACQEDLFLVGGRNNELLALNANMELWRIPQASVTPELVVAGTNAQVQEKNAIDGTNKYKIGVRAPYVSPSGKLWLVFRFGNNDGDDTSYLFTASSIPGSSWKLLSKSLPRNSILLGQGEVPLLLNGSPDEGAGIFRIGL